MGKVSALVGKRSQLIAAGRRKSSFLQSDSGLCSLHCRAGLTLRGTGQRESDSMFLLLREGERIKLGGQGRIWKEFGEGMIKINCMEFSKNK